MSNEYGGSLASAKAAFRRAQQENIGGIDCLRSMIEARDHLVDAGFPLNHDGWAEALGTTVQDVRQLLDDNRDRVRQIKHDERAVIHDHDAMS